MGEKFPGAFSGYTLDVKESHQKTKVDTSGTAKAVVESFVRMGTPFDVEDIVKVRDEAGQLSMGVPKENLSGA